jgi:membrane protease YdiL (CAAX protease family)
MEQRMNNERKKEALLRLLLILAIIAVIGVEIWYRADNAPTELKTDLYNSLSRLFGTAVALVFMLEFSLGTVLYPLGNKKASALLYILPALAIAINNFPWVSFLAGDCSMSASGAEMLFYAFMCLCVGLFEEVAFRGCVLMLLLKKRTHSKLAVFMAIFWSSVIFGAVHLVNLFTSSPVAVLLQIGYSALIGGMCSLVLLETKNIWICVFIHALYNFAGGVVPRFGEGMIWTAPEVALTAALAVVVIVYCVWRFVTMPLEYADNLLKKQEKIW